MKRKMKKIQHYQLILNVITNFILKNINDDGIDSTLNHGVPTRVVAELLDISIYKARLLLLEMEREGLVKVRKEHSKKSLMWYPLNMRK